MALDSPATWPRCTSTRSRCCRCRATSSEPPLSEAEQAYVETGTRWRSREGFHLFLQSAAPDAVGVAFNDSPAGLAAWLVEKYRRWSDCDGDVERRFSKDELCDFLTMYWATGTIASSMRLYLGERRDRWRLAPGRADRGPGRGRRLPRRDRPAAARVGGADLLRPAPLDRDAARRPLRRLRGAGAAGRRRDRVPGRRGRLNGSPTITLPVGRTTLRRTVGHIRRPPGSRPSATPR